MFPNDTLDPKQAGGAELLEAVCPGHVVVGESVACNIACPDGSSFAGTDPGWSLQRVSRGHFLSPTSDDAVLAMEGCESHGSNFGGTILLSRQSGKWTMRWYKSGIPTEKCHRVKLQSGREILICLGEYGGQGNVWTDLYVEDLLAPTPALMASGGAGIFEVFENPDACSLNPEDNSKPFPLRRHFIERVQFRNVGNGTIQGMSVFARYGERSMTVAQVEACINEQLPGKTHLGLDFRPPTKRYRVDFRFDGKQLVRVGESPGAPK
jgi:hypothetical protein